MWRGFYLLYVPTLARKARLYLEWNWAMSFPPDIAHPRLTRTDAVDPMYGLISRRVQADSVWTGPRDARGVTQRRAGLSCPD
jgi:hypothetical protein